ncbi:hypothetical protein Hanom_Chr07g00624941 [Helianthus anomalus]
MKATYSNPYMNTNTSYPPQQWLYNTLGSGPPGLDSSLMACTPPNRPDSCRIFPLPVNRQSQPPTSKIPPSQPLPPF